jgi:hypothetical protein
VADGPSPGSRAAQSPASSERGVAVVGGDIIFLAAGEMRGGVFLGVRHAKMLTADAAWMDTHTFCDVQRGSIPHLVADAGANMLR